MTEKELMLLFSRRLKELRTVNGFSQLDLSERINISQTYISMLEKGIKAPSLNTIANLAEALGVSVKELFLFSPDENDKLQSEIIAHLSGKSKNTLKKILGVVKVLDK